MKKLIALFVALIATTFVGFAAEGEEWYSYTDSRTYWIPTGSNDIWVFYGYNQKTEDIKNTVTRGGLVTTTYNIVKIDEYAYNNFGIVENVTIGSGIQTIGKYAFNKCSKLSKITFKGACANIDANAFTDLSALTEIVSEATTPVALNGFSAYYSKVKVTVPKGTKATYKATAGWKEFTNLVEEGETPTPVPTTYINIQIQLPNEWNAPASYTWESGDEIKAMTKAFSIGTYTWWNGQIKANTKFLVKNGANTTDWTYATQDAKGQSADVCLAIGGKMESGRYAITTTPCVEPPADPYIESFSVSPTSVQVGGSVTFTAVAKNFSGTPVITYSVKKNGGTDFVEATNPYAPTEAGEFIVKVVAKYNDEEANSTTTFRAIAAPVVNYYAKNNWESSEWSWKKMTKDGNLYKLEKVIFGGTGFNFNTKADDADAKWVEESKFAGDKVVAKDTVSFTYNPVGDVVTMTLIGRPAEDEPIVTAINITGSKYVNEELLFSVTTYGFKGTPTVTYFVKKGDGEYEQAVGSKYTPTSTGDYTVKAEVISGTQKASKEVEFTVTEKPVEKSYVAGDFTDWADNKRELPAEIELDAKDYLFKQITGTTWYGAGNEGATMTRGNSAWKLDGEQNVTLRADVKGTYKFELVGDVFTVTYPKEECTWTMVGDSKTLFGDTWKPELDANNMEEVDGVFVKSYSGKTFKKDDKIEFKAAKNHAWATTVPSGDNATYTFTEDGEFNITFILDEKGNKIDIDVKKHEVEGPTVTSINISGKKYVDNELTFTATVAGFSAEPMVIYEVKAEEGEYKQAQGGKFTPTAAGKYTVKATAFYQPEEGDAEEASLEVPFAVTEEPEAITVKLLASSTNWSEVAVYAWDKAETITGAWPGDKLTEKDGWYSYTIEGEHTDLQIIFNNNAAEGASQTVDTPISESKCYELGAADESGKFALSPRDCTLPKTTWTMVGNSDILFGTVWTPALVENDMEEVSGVFTKVYTNKAFTKGEKIEFKAAKNHAWNTSIPSGDNATYTFTEDGNFDITFTLDIAGDKVNIDVKPFAPTEPMVTGIKITGSKVVGEEIAFLASIAGFSAEPTVVYAVKAEGGEYEQAQGGKFTPEAAGDYTVKATATYTPEEGDAEEAFKEVEFTVTEEPAPGKEITVKLLASSTTWSEVAIYAWDNVGPIAGKWPGTKVTEEDGWYAYTIKDAGEGLQIIFNNNAAESTAQTVDTPVSESTCYELGAADESGKFALTARECTLPQIGYGIKIDGTTVVMGEKNPKAENEWMILNQSLAKGQTFALYDASTGGTWAVALDEASVPGVTKEENSYSVTADGCYSFYLKLIYGADQLYVGTGECPVPPAEPTVTAIDIAGDKVINNELTFTATVAGFSGEPTIVYYVKMKSAEDYTTPLEANKFTSVKPGDFMVKAVATYQPEEGDAEEASKEVEFTVTEEPQPTEGFGIKIDGETVVIGEKNPSPLDPSFEEWQVLNQALTAGQTVALYNAATGDSWAVALDPASVAGIEKGEGLYNITADGCYSFYIKLKFGEDQLYVGNGDCPVPPAEPTVTAIDIAGSKVVGEELTFTATVAGFSAEPMIIYEVKAEEGEYVQAQGGKFTPTAAGNYTVKATAFYQPEEGDAEEAFKEVEFTVYAEPPVTEGYGILVNGTTPIAGVKSEDAPEGFTQWEIIGTKLNEGDTFTLYDFKTKATWTVKLDESSMSGVTYGEESYSVTETHEYDLYIKLQFGNDQLYVGHKEEPTDAVWTVVGDAALMTSDWDPTDTNNDMIKQADGSYKLVIEKTLIAGVYQFKFVGDHSWQSGKEFPTREGKNLPLIISKDGTYMLTFTLNASSTKGGVDIEITTETPTNKAEATVIRYRNLIGQVVLANYKGVKLAEMSDGTTLKVQ